MNSFIISSYAQALIIGSRQSGMGKTSTSITDFWSIQNNQAGIALIDKISFGIYYENRFMTSGLSSQSAGFVYPTKIGVLGASFNYFGNQLYSDMKVGLAYARSFSPYFRIGIQLDFLQTKLGDNYGSKSNVTFELGIQSDVTKSLTIGAYVFNPIQVNLADYNQEKVPAVFRFGLGWKIGESLLVCVDAEKNTSLSPIVLRGGLEFNFQEKFYIRGGFTTYQEIFSMGFGVMIKIIRFDISASMHQSLGFSFQSSLIFQLSQKK